MMFTCPKCSIEFDDEFRSTVCPHGTFAANDGNNNFQHHVDSVGPPSPGNPCPKCNAQLHMGFGLAGGGYVAYMYCETCGNFDKDHMEEYES